MVGNPIFRYLDGIFVSSRVREQLATGITLLLNIEKRLWLAGTEQTGLTSGLQAEALN